MPNNMYEKFKIALQLINDEVPEDILYNKTIATPAQIVLPEAWLLGSTGNSAVKAGRMGVGYSFAQFFNGEMTTDILDAIEKQFNHLLLWINQKLTVSYMVTTAESKEEAEYEAFHKIFELSCLTKGKIGQLITPEEAQIIH